MNLLIILCLTLLTGCAGVSNVSYPLADGTYKNMRTTSNPQPLVLSPPVVVVEICQPQADRAEIDLTNCREVMAPNIYVMQMDLSGNLRVTPGTLLSGEDQPNDLIRTSGGGDRLFYFVGKGLADSGSKTTNTTSANGGAANQWQRGDTTSTYNLGARE